VVNIEQATNERFNARDWLEAAPYARLWMNWAEYTTVFNARRARSIEVRSTEGSKHDMMRAQLRASKEQPCTSDAGIARWD
jgi:hypothetical protein